MASCQHSTRLVVLAALLVLASCGDHPFSFKGLGNKAAATSKNNELDAMLKRNNAAELRSSFADFKAAYGKGYGSTGEEDSRFSNFVATLKDIAASNKDATRTYWVGVNDLSDLTPSERQAMLMQSVPSDAAAKVKAARRLASQEPAVASQADRVHLSAAQRRLSATGVDWRTSGGVSPVKNQGGCGSCWAFAATACIESAYMIQYGYTPDLSEQQLVSCSGAGSCGGGSSGSAINYVYNYNQTVETAFPYTATNAACSPAIRTNPVISLSAPVRSVTLKSATALQAAVARQPIVFYFQVEGTFGSYAGGVYNGPCVNNTINHAMLVVGYGFDASGAGYWIVKNSWGTGWGVSGFINIAMKPDGSSGLCGMYAFALYYVDMATTGKGFDTNLAGCSSGYYRDAASATCVQCKGGAASPSGATQESQCYCTTAGTFYRGGAGCVACSSGAPTTTGAAVGGQSCTCAYGYSSFNAATGVCSPLSCPQGSYLAAAGNSCTQCALSAVTKYAAASPAGSTSESACSCEVTPTASYYYKASTNTTSGCSSCGSGTTGQSTDGLTCTCADGYERFNATSGTCSRTPCPAGQYTSGSGCASCAQSGVAAAAAPLGANNEGQCACPAPGSTYYVATQGCRTCVVGSSSTDGKLCKCTTGTWDAATNTCKATTVCWAKNKPCTTATASSCCSKYCNPGPRKCA